MPSMTRHQNLSDTVYEQLKSELFEFQLLPGDRFTEVEIAERTGASRTPVREALFRLQREGFIDVNFRNGWEVRPLDFNQLDALYELRILLEQASIRRMKLLSKDEFHSFLQPLENIWCVRVSDRSGDTIQVAQWDEQFHCALVAASKNSEFIRVHREVTDRIRIVRRLDFTDPSRITATYAEHKAMIGSLRAKQFAVAASQLETHINISRVEVRKLTLLRLQNAKKDFGTYRTELTK